MSLALLTSFVLFVSAGWLGSIEIDEGLPLNLVERQEPNPEVGALGKLLDEGCDLKAGGW